MLTAALLGFAEINTDACTNVLITKGASVDGSNMISYAADSHLLFGELYFAKAGVWNAGEMRRIEDWDTGKYLGDIPQASRTYQRVGNMNEYQLIIAETTYGGREELHDPNGIMDYGSLIYVALERTKTAREAIKLIVELANTYGYYSSGESFSLADKDEVWVMELIGKGPENKGIVWVARRVPDGYICSHANQARISTFPLNDPENCMYAPDVITFAREKGYFSGEDNEVTKDSYDYVEYAMGYDATKRFPLFVKPARKLSVKDAADVMRDHYEGTPMDMTKDIGAGGNALPYRWRPMNFQHEGKTYFNERAIATQQTGFWFVGQVRGSLPDEIGAVNWFGCDDAATSYLTPIYVSTYDVPECFRVGNGDLLTYSPTSAFWMTNRVANTCYRAYNIMFPTIDAEIDAWELSMIEAVAKADQEALAIYKDAAGKPKKNLRRNDKARKVADQFDVVRQYLTDFSISNAQKIFDKWVALEQHLLVKFMDGNIKAQNEDGSFVTNQHTTTIPAKLRYAGYTDKWKEAVAKDHGHIVEEK